VQGPGIQSYFVEITDRVCMWWTSLEMNLGISTCSSLCDTSNVRPVYSFHRFRADPLKTTMVTSQLCHPLHSNGLLRMGRPTENPASKALRYCYVSALPRK
jgi:hypothetical protein